MGLKISDYSNTHFRVQPSNEDSVEQYRRLFFAMKLKVEGYRFMPAYKYGEWDGTIEYLHYKSGLVKLGLYKKTLQIINDCNIEVDFLDDKIVENRFTGFPREEIVEFLKAQKVYSKGSPLLPRDYQLESVIQALTQKRLLVQSPTSSGKSLIIYFIIKFLLPQIQGKVLLIVPTTNLVNQMFADFADYENANKVAWAETSTNKKHTGAAQVFISTWQSVIRQKNREWWSQFDVLMVDEAHHCKATSLNKISDNLPNAEFRFGFSGSINENWKDTSFWTIVAQFGRIYTTTTTKSLIAEKQIASAKVVLVELDHTSERIPRLEYQNELKYICSSPKRNKVIESIVSNATGNTLVLFSLVQIHGKVLYEDFKKAFPQRTILYVSGEVEAEEREQVRQYTENNNNVVIIASYQTFSTGVNIKNLHNVIFASPTKSFTRVVQSIGRGLRKSDTKDECTIYDLFDLLYGTPDKMRRTNYTYRHFLNRLEIYKREGFPIKMLRQKIIKTPIANPLDLC